MIGKKRLENGINHEAETRTTKPLNKSPDHSKVTFGEVEGFEIVEVTKSSWLQYLKSTLCHIGLILLLIGFTAAGAYVFSILEHPHEVSTKNLKLAQLSQMERNFIKLIMPCRSNDSQLVRLAKVRDKQNSLHLHSNVMDYNQDPVPYLQWLDSLNKEDHERVDQLFHQARSQLHEYASLLLNSAKYFEVAKNGSIRQAPNLWTLRKALFFAATVISTIGYGNVVPVTTYGQLFCMGYALFGIPLLLLVVTDLGTLFSKFILFVWIKFSKTVERNVVSIFRLQNNQVIHKVTERVKVPKHDFKLPIWLAFLLLGLYIAMGAGLFLLWEQWTFFQSFYFVFITMTTIGFGDIIPKHTTYLLLMTIYILIGFAGMTTCVQLVIHTYIDRLKNLRQHVEVVAAKTGEGAENFTKYLTQSDKVKKSDKTKDRTKIYEDCQHRHLKETSL